MIIGVPKETKEEEYRISLIPKHVKLLVDDGYTVHIENDAGLNAGFSNDKYIEAGAIIKTDVWDADFIVKVKEPAIDKLKEKQTIMAYLHIEKNQSPELLQALLDKKITSYASEEIRNSAGERQVNLGFEAGIVGMYKGLRQILGNKIPSMWDHTLKQCYFSLLSAEIPTMKIGIMGNGLVSFGAQEVLRRSGIRFDILDRTKTKNIEKYLPDYDVIVNAVVWNPTVPRIITEANISLMKKDSFIIDISCDKNGAIETCIPTTWKNPTYVKCGIMHMCIDNLPSAIAHETSTHISHMIFPYLIKALKNEDFFGLMTINGEFVFTNHPNAKNSEEFLILDPLKGII